MSARTVRQWQTEPEFRAAVEDARGELLAAGIGALVANVTDAVEGLMSIGRDTGANANARASAYTAVVAQVVKLAEQRASQEMGRRIQAVEQALQEKMDKTIEYRNGNGKEEK